MLNQSIRNRNDVEHLPIVGTHFLQADALLFDESDFANPKGETVQSKINLLSDENRPFAYCGFKSDACHLPRLLSGLEEKHKTYLVETNSDLTIYLSDPLQSSATAMTVSDWTESQPATSWRRIFLPTGEGYEAVADYLTRRVWLWNGTEEKAHYWHLLVRWQIHEAKLKCILSNTTPLASLRHLMEIQAIRNSVTA